MDGRKRVVIEGVYPEIDCGRFPIKRAVGERVDVEADVFSDGHDEVAAFLLYRKADADEWSELAMTPLLNDRWRASCRIEEMGEYLYTIKGGVDHFSTWRKDVLKKIEAGQDITADLTAGVEMLRKAAKTSDDDGSAELLRYAEALQSMTTRRDTEGAEMLLASEGFSRLFRLCFRESLATVYGKELRVTVDRKKALCSAWYEFFPRSCYQEGKTCGTFSDAEKLLPEIARMGFDVVYLPPIHPIGKTNRKGKNNSPKSLPDDPGSPWAIGSIEGGHKAICPELGTMDDFVSFMKRASELGLEVALDLAFQCSPDHPYVKEHPEWFKWRPDGTIQHAENPPKKYEDVVPFDFECESWESLWEELKSIALFWIDKGVKIFRVDNPHTKPFAFWGWFIGEIKEAHPEVIFLAEAFTRPKVMYRLAKLGFSQSYTYFAWRNTKWEITEYMKELTSAPVREFFRPNFWPNTPDILPEYLQYGGRPAFIVRLVLAATLSPNYGIYGPAFELCVSEATPGREEYLNSEKYEIKRWNWDAPGNLKDLIARINRARRENLALQEAHNVKFCEADDENILFYCRATEDLESVILVAANLDPFHAHEATLQIPIGELGISEGQSYLLEDLLGGEKFISQGDRMRFRIDPAVIPCHIFRVRRRLRRESDFDYFM
jgi:starch synthase (maltosyl-transferring)